MSSVPGRLAFGENDGPVRGTVLCQCVRLPICRGEILVNVEGMTECLGFQGAANSVDAERGRKRHGLGTSAARSQRQRQDQAHGSSWSRMGECSD